MCQTCADNKSYRPTPWFNHVWMLYQLQQGGYPFEKNDLELSEWMAIAEMKQAMELPAEIPKRP